MYVGDYVHRSRMRFHKQWQPSLPTNWKKLVHAAQLILVNPYSNLTDKLCLERNKTHMILSL